MEFQETNCLNCNSDEFYYYDEENGYKLVKCKRCGLLYVRVRPSDNNINNATRTGLHLGSNELDVNSVFNVNTIDRYESVLSDFFIPANFKGKSWLDIGSGNGEFISALTKFSNNSILVKGSEPNINKIENAKRHGLDVENIDLEHHDVQYDFISLLNVYSHLPYPIQTIKSWSKLLKEGGELFIETGNSSHLSSKYHMKPYLLPDHLSFANKTILIQILKKAGFKVLEIKIYRGVYDKKVNVPNVIKELIKLLLGRKNRFYSFFPKYQHGDMYIKAKKEQ